MTTSGSVTQVTPAMTFNLSLDPYPRVTRVYETCMAMPAFADAHPSKQPDAKPGVSPASLPAGQPATASR